MKVTALNGGQFFGLCSFLHVLEKYATAMLFNSLYIIHIYNKLLLVVLLVY